MNSISLISVAELLDGRYFFIPAYQRGYRWGKDQMWELLDDLYEFSIRKKEDGEFYCLQPVIVQPISDENKLSEIRAITRWGDDVTADKTWEVVDGQQRLTSLYIIYRYLIEKQTITSVEIEDGEFLLYNLCYETRPETKEFLENLSSKSLSEENIDLWYITRAYKAIQEWFDTKGPIISEQYHRRSKPSDIRKMLADILRNTRENSSEAAGSAQFIWYELSARSGKNPIDEFVSINNGKIRLTDAELIKGLFLQKRNFISDRYGEQMKIAMQWESIENTLHQNDFWNFLSSSDDSDNRIELLFTLLYQQDNNGDLPKDGNLFRYYYGKLTAQSGDELESLVVNEWSRVLQLFSVLQGWYEDPVLYNIVGFLIHSEVSLFDIVAINQSLPANAEKNEFGKRLEELIAKQLPKKDDIAKGEISYKYNNTKKSTIRSLLLFLNIFMLNNQMAALRKKSRTLMTPVYKFPFDLYVSQNWDVEHIDSATQKTIELSFVYGSKVKSQDGKSSRFELLDGQQRITTLVLLHWLLACMSGKEIPQFIKAFNYETRTTSETFLKQLADNPLDVINEKPSDSLRNRQWYTLSFDKDNSVRGMLRMLDAMYFRYLESPKKEQLYDNLDNIKFYELDLDDFGLTEEIYVKMNARGLQLTPFENFKADLTKLLKDETIPEFSKMVEMDIAGHPKVHYYLNISQKIDNRWLDLFWSKDDGNGRDYCDRFFRFFFRFFTTKYYLEIQKDLKADSFRPVAQPDTEESKIWNFLWVLSDRQDKTYFGFRYYDKFLRANPAYMSEIEHVLDTFSNPEYLKVIQEESIYPWEKTEKRQAQFFEKNYQLTDAVYFAAVCEYIKRSTESFDVANFRRWMRVVRNIVENILFRNVDEIVRLVRRLVVILDLPDAMINVYKALASDGTPTERESRTLKEEMLKAKIICNDTTQDWESAFITAEAHPFFRGAIGFMLEDLPNTVEAFLHRNEILSQLFDENGMTDYAKYNHRLIRSMVRMLSTRPLLKETALTEREDRTHHLKAMMLEKEPVKHFLSKLGDKNNIDDVVGYLDEYCDNPTIDFSQSEAELIPAEPDIRFIRAFTRLCLDNRLYDFIRDVEQRERVKHVEVSFRDDNIAIARPRSWYDWIFLGTERASIINDMLTLGYYFINEFKDQFYNRAEFYANYGDYWGFRVWVYRDINETQKLTVELHQSGKARFLYKSDDTLAESVFPNSPVHDMWNEWRIICEVDGAEMTDLPGILVKADEVEKALVKAYEKSESKES